MKTGYIAHLSLSPVPFPTSFLNLSKHDQHYLHPIVMMTIN